LVSQKSATFGIVAEAKKSLPKNQQTWASFLEQLRKYDDFLTGWWTQDQQMPEYNALLLLHHSRSRLFIQYLQEALRTDPAAVGPRSAVVEFSTSMETELYYFFRLEYGALRDAELHPRLASGVQIPFERVLTSYPSLHYYDSEPPTELLLTELWSGVFPSLLGDLKIDEALNAFPLRVSVAELTLELQRAFGSATLPIDVRSVEFPKQSWVRKALDRLVGYKYAKPPDQGDTYTVLYRPFKKDVMERFIDLALSKSTATGNSDPQLLLFADGEESGA